MDSSSHRVRRVSYQEFSQALQRAGYGLGAGLAFRYDARRDETIWMVDGQPVGLTVGRVGSIRACYLAEHKAVAAAAGASNSGRKA
ncbi:hypothetical protein [Azohydromonas lata]|uniref:hypothetical protein n=1 Tax=Azohydromonas lata TaxID=45677 RepID=UPI00082A3066|nr:hypothetical protein [Azohydromonas lata]